jgi:hypothetical protein
MKPSDMKPAEALHRLSVAANGAGCLFINPPPVASGLRDHARGAVARACRLSRPTRSAVARLPLAIAAAVTAAEAVQAMALASACPLDRAVIYAPAVYLREAAAVARACLAPGCATLAEAARLAACDSAAIAAAAALAAAMKGQSK